jgi:hypothetical protein
MLGKREEGGTYNQKPNAKEMWLMNQLQVSKK